LKLKQHNSRRFGGFGVKFGGIIIAQFGQLILGFFLENGLWCGDGFRSAKIPR